MEKNKIEELLGFLAEEPDDSFVKYALALEYVKAGHFDAALLYLNAVVERDENYLAAYYQLGKLLERTGDPVKAESIYLKGISIARVQSKKHTLSELTQAYNLLKGIEEDDL